MICPNCGNENENGAQFCGICGAPFAQKKSKKPILIVIIAVVAALVIGTIGFFVVSTIRDKAEKEKQREEWLAKEAEEEQEDSQESEDIEEPEETEEPEPEEVEEPVTAWLMDAPAALGDNYRLPVAQAMASSVIDQEGHDNSADMVLDGKNESSWQEGVPGEGIGEGLTFYLDGNYEVNYLSFKLGNWRDGSYYEENHRPQRLKITVGDFETEITFPDEKTEHWVEIDGDCEASEVKIEIASVYYGTSAKWDDTCIAEIGIYGEDID